MHNQPTNASTSEVTISRARNTEIEIECCARRYSFRLAKRMTATHNKAAANLSRIHARHLGPSLPRTFFCDLLPLDIPLLVEESGSRPIIE